MMSGKRIGEVTHYYNKIGVAVIDLIDTIKVGDMVHFLGSLSDFRQKVESLQIEHEAVEEVGAGQEVAMKVDRPVRNRDKVFKLEEAE